MGDDPGLDLEAMLAADEAAIGDDGFSASVMTQVAAGLQPVRSGLRRLVVGGAGALGFGVAGFSVSSALKLAPASLPPAQSLPAAHSVSGWLDGLSSQSVQTALSEAASSPMLLLGVLVALAAVISLTAAAMQEN